jgi:hypothetical protein
MKTLTLLVLAISLSAPAFAAFPGGQKLASVNQLAGDATSFGEMTEAGGSGCHLSVEKYENGVRIAMESDEEGRIFLDARYDGAVLLTERNEEDGSYVKEYELPGQGKLTAVFADDSYFHAQMEAQGQTISCEIDY